ncbi:permease-like cell division protein FtsX [Spongorhabdus nitratireducens]
MSQTNEPSAPRGAARQTAAEFSLSYLTSLHKEVASTAFHRLFKTPLGTALTCFVIAISLTLPTLLYIGTENLREVAGRWDGTPQMTLFLEKETATDKISALRKKLENTSEVAQVQYLTPDEALAEYEAFSGNSNLVRHLNENPLPPVFIIQFDDTVSADTAGQLQSELLQNPIVDVAQLDLEWVQRLQQLNRLASQGALALGLLFGITVLLAIGNTIRLAVENRRSEIRIIKLVGGTDGYVTLPFIYMGMWYGLLGGLLAWILTGALAFWLNDSLNELARLYSSDFRPHGPDILTGVALCFSGAMLGVLGAIISCSRQLRSVEI